VTGQVTDAVPDPVPDWLTTAARITVLTDGPTTTSPIWWSAGPSVPRS
jgi:hypothetical protein